jgi:hypothetical protein
MMTAENETLATYSPREGFSLAALGTLAVITGMAVWLMLGPLANGTGAWIAGLVALLLFLCLVNVAWTAYVNPTYVLMGDRIVIKRRETQEIIPLSAILEIKRTPIGFGEGASATYAVTVTEHKPLQFPGFGDPHQFVQRLAAAAGLEIR